MGLISKTSLLRRIRKGKRERAQLVESNLAQGIAFQIRAARDAQGLSQDALAQMIGMSQNNLSRLENPEYGKHTISSLKRISEALDLAVVVRFVPFSQYIAWLSRTPYLDPGISPEALAPPSFSKEEESGTFDISTTYWGMTRGMRTSEPSENLLRALNPTLPPLSKNKDGKKDAIDISAARKSLRVLNPRGNDAGNGNLSTELSGISGGEMRISEEPEYTPRAQSY